MVIKPCITTKRTGWIKIESMPHKFNKIIKINKLLKLKKVLDINQEKNEIIATWDTCFTNDMYLTKCL